MADLVFILLAAVVVFLVVLRDNSCRMKKTSKSVAELIADVEAGTIKYKHEMISRLKEL